jgi:hypothetical protein
MITINTPSPDNIIGKLFTREKTLIFIVHSISSGDKKKKIGKFVYIAKPRHVDSKTIQRRLFLFISLLSYSAC